MKLFLKLLLSTTLILAPLTSFADKMSADEMKTTCLTGFMKDADKASDVDAYKSYVDKLCSCSGSKLGGQEVDQAGVMAGIGSCMRTALLSESMNKLKSDDAVNESKISTACMKEWQIFTSPNKGNQGTLEKSCACAAKEIMGLDADKRTDDSQLDQIAMKCASKDT
jgi:hypothetical protein